MRNYVIINGVNSLDIKGLAISKLPSISKPPLRVMTEEIDGRDGDIITELGYGSYDKELVIGLYENYDINEIIGFFNQEGTIVFSNEDDKYYNFKIINQIDYEALIKFRTANVTLHCQPFKYPLEEDPIELIDTYVEEEGEELTLTPTEEAPMEITLKGNTSQVVIQGEEGLEVEGTSITLTDVIPTKENYIIPKGNTSQVQYSGKNKIGFVNKTGTTNGVTYTIEDNVITLNGTATGYGFISAIDYITTTGNYTLSIIPISGTWSAGTIGVNGTKNGSQNWFINCTYPNTNATKNLATIDNDTNNLLFSSSGVFNNYKFKLQLEEGTSGTEYEPYCGGIPSPNPSYPQDIHSVSGDNEIEVCGKNRFNSFIISNSFIQVDNEGVLNVSNVTTANGYCDTSKKLSELCPTLKEGDTAYLYIDTDFYEGGQKKERIYIAGTIWNNGTSKTITSAMLNGNVIVYGGYQSTSHLKIVISREQLTSYEPYTGNTYHITLPNGIELNKIGTYQDYIYKDSDKWYLHKEIGETIINGNNVSIGQTYSNLQYARFNKAGAFIGNGSYTYYPVISDKAISMEPTTLNDSAMIGKITPTASTSYWWVGFALNETLENIQTKLNNMVIYYPIATPTYTEITDTTLLSQLDDLYNATIYETTNISSIPNDLEPFIDIKYNVVTPSPSPQRPSAINVVSGTNTIKIANEDDSESQTFNIRLGSLKLYKLNDTQDYIYKSADKWYIRNHAKEKTFTGAGSEGWGCFQNGRGEWCILTTNIRNEVKQGSSLIADILPFFSSAIFNGLYNQNAITLGGKNIELMIGGINENDDELFTDFLAIHNLTILYELATPIDTEITDTDLIEDLEALLEATSYNPETNITQTSNDKPFIIYAKALEGGSGEAEVINEGNIYAKPIFEIEGNGEVQVLIDNNEVLQVDTTNDTIIIDTENMEAINKSDNTLANRQVIGDYSKIKLVPGESNVKLTGNYTKGTITKYTRYL